MKRILTFFGAAIAALFLCPILQADSGHITYDNYLPIPNPVAYSSTFSVRTDAINWASSQIVVTSATSPNETFNDGQAATTSWTVASYTALSTATATGQYTVVSTASLSGSYGSATIVVASTAVGTVISFTGPPILIGPFIEGSNWISSTTLAQTATNLSALITPTTTSGIFTSSVVNSTNVLVSCVSSGTFCNAYAVTSSSAPLVSTAAFSGGTAPVYISFNGANLTAGNQWQVGANTTATALNIAAALNTYIGTTTAVSDPIISTNTANVVYSTAIVAGTAANNYSLGTSSPALISTSGYFMTGGQNNATFSINGFTFTANNSGAFGFYPVTSTAQTATNIAAAIALNYATVGATATAAGSVVYTTATIIGPAGDYATFTSSQAALTLASYTSSNSVTGVGSGFLAGGTASSYTINGSVIQLPVTQNFGLGQGVYLTQTTGSGGLSPLVVGTTYYVIPGTTGSGQVQLALTSTGAIAGLSIVLTSSAVKTTADVFQLNQIGGAGGQGATGTSSVQWVVSDDQTHWVPYTLTPFNITVPSQTYGTYFSTGSVSTVDFGHMDFSYLGLSVTASTQAPTSVAAHIIGNAP